MVGTVAKNFVLQDQSGLDWELYKNLGKNVLLIFYPKDNTYICTRQLADYNRNLELFLTNNISPVAVNTGSVQSHKSFCENIDLRFPMLSDTRKEISTAFKALSFFGGNKRKLVLISTEKYIVYENNIFNLSFPDSHRVLSNLDKLNIIKLT